MSRKIIVIAAVILAASLFWWSESLELRSDLKLSGNFEIDETALSFRVSGLLINLTVEEGALISSGTVVARLDPTEFELSVARASAAVSIDQAFLNELVNGSRPEEIALAKAARDIAETDLQKLKAGLRPQEVAAARALKNQTEALISKNESILAEAQKNEKRVTRLFQCDAVSEKEYLAAQTALKVAKQNLQEAIANNEAAKESLSMAVEGIRAEDIEKAGEALALADAKYKLALEGPRKEKIDQAKARLEASKIQLEQAKLTLSFASLKSPVSGTVMVKAAEPGEYIRQGQPIVTIGNLQRIFLRVYVNETQFNRVNLGQQVEITTDSFPDEKFFGTITYISPQAEFTPKTVQTHEERVKLVYRIKISVLNEALKLKPGMPADAILKSSK